MTASLYLHFVNGAEPFSQNKGRLGGLTLKSKDGNAANAFIHYEDLEKFISELSDALDFLRSLLPTPPKPEHIEPYTTCSHPDCRHGNEMAAKYDW